MPPSDFAAVWDRLPEPVRVSLRAHPARSLTPEHVDALAQAGGHDTGALWLDVRRGYPRQWRTTWAFQRHVENLPRAGSSGWWGGLDAILGARQRTGRG